jgi:hypothetical protein
MDSPGQTVSLKSEKFEMDLGSLAQASEVAEEHTLPFSKMVRHSGLTPSNKLFLKTFFSL